LTKTRGDINRVLQHRRGKKKRKGKETRRRLNEKKRKRKGVG